MCTHSCVCVCVCVHSSHTFKLQTLHNTTRMHARVASGCPALCARGRRTRRHAPFSATTPRGWLQQQQLVPEVWLLRLSHLSVDTSCSTDRQAVPTASGCRVDQPLVPSDVLRLHCCLLACDRVVVVVEVVDGRRMELNIQLLLIFHILLWPPPPSLFLCSLPARWSLQYSAVCFCI